MSEGFVLPDLLPFYFRFETLSPPIFKELMANVGFIGWRGMVGSVLMDRMRAEGDFAGLNSTFFSTSNPGGQAPTEATGSKKLEDAFDTKKLAEFDILVSCQGGDYTKQVYPQLRKAGWKGYWIDAASTLRMESDAVIVLDPVNRDIIDSALKQGLKTYVGGNCTVSLLIMAIGGLLREGLVEWVNSSTYQAASGAGAKQMTELVQQMSVIGSALRDNPAASAVALEARVSDIQRNGTLEVKHFPCPLAGSLIPWIDRAVDDGQTREEWKADAELNKILNTKKRIPVDGICVRVGVLRCHSQAATIKLTRDIPLKEIEKILASGNDWVRVVPNTPEETVKHLTPVAVSGKLDVAVGRIHKLKMGPEYLGLFTVGDQLLWGAAEPIRRILAIIRAAA